MGRIVFHGLAVSGRNESPHASCIAYGAEKKWRAVAIPFGMVIGAQVAKVIRPRLLCRYIASKVHAGNNSVLTIRRRIVFPIARHKISITPPLYLSLSVFVPLVTSPTLFSPFPNHRQFFFHRSLGNGPLPKTKIEGIRGRDTSRRFSSLSFSYTDKLDRGFHVTVTFTSVTDAMECGHYVERLINVTLRSRLEEIVV